MAAKEVKFGDSARAYPWLKVLMSWLMQSKGHAWPKGRNVVLERSYGWPQPLLKTVFCRQEIELRTNLPNMGAQMVKGSCFQDLISLVTGTTTATIAGSGYRTRRHGVRCCWYRESMDPKSAVSTRSCGRHDPLS